MNLIDWIILCIAIACATVFCIAVLAALRDQLERDSMDEPESEPDNVVQLPVRRKV
jgi:hypothetical protein